MWWWGRVLGSAAGESEQSSRDTVIAVRYQSISGKRVD